MGFNDRNSFRGRDSNRGGRDGNRGGFRGGRAAPEKCTRLSVLTAVLRLKFLSSQQKDGRFTAGNAFLTTGNSKFEYSLMGVVL